MKKLNLELAGQDGNIFFLMGYFRREAKRKGWTEEEMKAITDKIEQSISYDNAIGILMNV